ncbi:postacrosomal sheath WW domain-binding protein-like isoform X1 [Haliotis rufescens]|uniref:postacrosomal sheath WW domain-binding protein-like isoform X1 n=1 Tax=Haliotis rufescens TaxID=6454 RepID=UPI00201F8A2B|nr:postacrosomal sheath WW domain-binding protein-like isoform X1 [Haliotis rufescens]
MKVLAVIIVCLVAITRTHGFGIGFPPFGGIGNPHFGLGFPHFGLRIPGFGLGMHPFGLGIPPLGYGISPYGPGVSPYGLGVSPLGLGSGLPNQGLVHPGLQGAGAIQSNGNGPVYVDLDANAAAVPSAAAPTTIAATDVAPAGPAVYDPTYMIL